MKITLSQYAGFCDGVKRAYEMVSVLNMARAKKPVMILGSLVHNPEVNQKIAKKGITRIDRDYFFKAKPGEIGTLIITAHGTGPDVYMEAKRKKIKLIDVTCPKVVKVQRLAKVFSGRGYKIVIIGDKGHKEVLGICDWSGKNALIVSNNSDLKRIRFSPKEKIAVLSQTTQNEEFFRQAAEIIKKKCPLTEILFTTCHTTHQRQKEIKKLAEGNNPVVVIGSMASANSKRLFEIAREVNPRTYFIENVEGLNKRWFSGAKKVAVSAGASTPSWIIEEIMGYLGKIN